LWRDELHVVLAPRQVALVRIEWMLTRRGLIPRVGEKCVVDCSAASAGETSWHAAITQLETEMPRMLARKMAAKVILSNHFMHYTLMPWSETLSDEAEDEAYARHCFRQLYGADSEQWELRLSPQPAGLPQLASAMDRGLLAALRGVFERNGITLSSIQPHLMAAYNNCRLSLKEHSGWFALYEAGCLCLALLQQGRWVSVRTMRIGSDWCGQLALVLERESYLAEPEIATQAVFLWAPELGAAVLPGDSRWQIHNLQPRVRPALVPEYEGRFAMAMSE
jgi:hypothetical protein